MNCHIIKGVELNAIKDKEFNSSARLVNVAALLLSLELQKTLRDNQIGISIEEWRMLFYLWEPDGVNQNELSSRSNKEKSTVARQIEALEKKGLIERRNDGNDKRHKSIFLTEKGLEIKSKSLKLAESIVNKAEKGISGEELKIVRKVLSKMIDNLRK